MRSLHPEAVVISAVTGEGIGQLEAAITKALADRSDEVELRIPYERGDVLATIHRVGEVLVEEHEGDGTKVRARLPRTRRSPSSIGTRSADTQRRPPDGASAAPTIPASLRRPGRHHLGARCEPLGELVEPAAHPAPDDDAGPARRASLR